MKIRTWIAASATVESVNVSMMKGMLLRFDFVNQL